VRVAPLVLLLAAVLTGCTRSSDAAVAGSPYTLMQMNLCLSGVAGCFNKVDYPSGVSEAVARIREQRPEAVTANEACSGDIALIAGRTGYHEFFSKVIYFGRPLACIHPSGRGLFGEALLTKTAVENSATAPFKAQAGPERRVWLCVRTQAGVEVCTAHLASPAPDEIAANGPQCDELRAILARRAALRNVIFGGDVNRHGSCAPAGFWTRTDASGHQDPGSQQVYGSSGLRMPSARVVPATHTDHDFLLVRTYLTVTAHRHKQTKESS
jgi:endonuclease/exonuclease/phosphatase family metal-dependent hydrolase